MCAPWSAGRAMLGPEEPLPCRARHFPSHLPALGLSVDPLSFPSRKLLLSLSPQPASGRGACPRLLGEVWG